MVEKSCETCLFGSQPGWSRECMECTTNRVVHGLPLTGWIRHTPKPPKSNAELQVEELHGRIKELKNKAQLGLAFADEAQKVCLQAAEAAPGLGWTEQGWGSDGPHVGMAAHTMAELLDRYKRLKAKSKRQRKEF